MSTVQRQQTTVAMVVLLMFLFVGVSNGQQKSMAAGSPEAFRAFNRVRSTSSPQITKKDQTMPLNWFNCRQVVNDKTAIIGKKITGNIKPGEQLQYVLYYFEGPTDGWIDGKDVESTEDVISNGTKTYETAGGGTNTVVKLRLLNEQEKLSKKQKEQAEAEAEAARLKALENYENATTIVPTINAEYRTWNSANGKFSIEAKYISRVQFVVKLEKRDGSTVKVPQDRLSENDVKYIKDFKKRERDLKR